MAHTPKWIRRFNRVTCGRVDHPAFDRLLRYLWRYRRKDGRWMGDVIRATRTQNQA